MNILPTSPSYIIVRKGTLDAVMETFSTATALKVNSKAYDVLPALEYLQRFNASVRNQA